MDRRTFLKISSLGSMAFAAGCSSDPKRNLYTLVHAPEDMVTGQATWYATTCRECPAGCGVLAKNREGRAIKLEGNPLHPVNQGKLCARGQAALQGLYNPDRITQPHLKTGKQWKKISFDQAVQLLHERLSQAAEKGLKGTAMLTETVGTPLLALFNTVLTTYGADPPLIFEPFAYESLKFAHELTFGRPILPDYHLDRADFLVGFGADFLETWLSPVAYARKFKAMHAMENGSKGRFVHISAYQSLTAANADQWLACCPGSEAAVALMLVNQVLSTRRGHRFNRAFREPMTALTAAYTPEKVSQITDIALADLKALIQRLLKARAPLVLGGSSASNGPVAVVVDTITLLLNILLDPDLTRYDFTQRHRVEIAGSRSQINDVLKTAEGNALNLLILNNVNPFYALPGASTIAATLARDKTFVVAFSNFWDETTVAADLVFPVQMPLETWDLYDSRQNTTAVLQPVSGKMTDAPNIGDVFLGLLPQAQRTADDYRAYLYERLYAQSQITSRQAWATMLQYGGLFKTQQPVARPLIKLDEIYVAKVAELVTQLPSPTSDADMLYLSPSLRHYDGRGANRPWLSEIPDPITQTAWQSLAWIHPQTLSKQGWAHGEFVTLETAYGRLDVQVYAYDGLHPRALVVPLGQGHTDYGRFAAQMGVNPVVLSGSQTDAFAGAPDYSVAVIKMAHAGAKRPLATLSGSRTQHDRKIALSLSFDEAITAKVTPEGLTMDDFPLTLPLPQEYAHDRDIYPPHDHAGYRWGMVVDLDRCIGCSACVAACYAENNVGVAGEQQIIKGREMAWLRIERYLQPDNPARQIFLPMMCQHCDNAPCESVCPVYAPHHSKEGINNQIYNRCIGTRFCAQNCPYKVRRFNWFDWQWPEPLHLQLNPNVTVRSKGVMEKCSFCIQRIKAAHGKAKNEKRTIQDGEVIPACVQTCPTNAITFGNLMDAQSAVRRLVANPRAYQVMGYLNTKPAVIYLKKVVQTI